MTAKLAFRGVSAGYGARPALRDLDLEVLPGQVVGLVGPNGAGKSTALRVAAGLLQPSAGLIELGGRPLPAWPRAELARCLAVVQQSQLTPPLVRVREYVALGRTPHIRFFANESEHDWAAVDQAMATAGVGELAQRRLDELSGGERQRVLVARALAQEPAVLLLDEPTSNLDLKYQQLVLGLAVDLARRQDAACLVVLHDITLAARFCDRIGLLGGGRLVASGPPAEVLQAELLSRVYETELEVLRHPASGRPVVVHGEEG